jgi:hypothetical protein
VRVGRAIGLAAAVGALVFGGAAFGRPAQVGAPDLLIGRSVAPDFEQLARETYAQFVAEATGVGECVRGPRLEAVYEMEELAVYDQETHIMRVRVPAPAPSLRASLIHELAHHLELSCPSQTALRSRFLAAQGMQGDVSWFGGAEWQDVPSEQFAEAVVVNVLGARERHLLRVQLTPEAIDLVATWLAAGG